MRYHYIYTRRAKIKKTDNAKCGQECGACEMLRYMVSTQWSKHKWSKHTKKHTKIDR